MDVVPVVVTAAAVVVVSVNRFVHCRVARHTRSASCYVVVDKQPKRKCTTMVSLFYLFIVITLMTFVICLDIRFVKLIV